MRNGADNEAVIEVGGLRMRYGEVDVLDGLDFTARRGEVLLLLGPNGAGKTTTIEILEGFRMRSAGEVIINVTKEGNCIVNQKLLSHQELEAMLAKVSALFPDQPVIIRADEKTMHKHIVRVLDACASANIWDISFAATTDQQ